MLFALWHYPRTMLGRVWNSSRLQNGQSFPGICCLGWAVSGQAGYRTTGARFRPGRLCEYCCERDGVAACVDQLVVFTPYA